MAQGFTLSYDDRAAVAAAVAEAELKSAGEIVTITADASDSYADVALVWSAAVGLLALCALAIAPDFYLALITRLTGEWEFEWTAGRVFELALSVATIKFGSMWLLQLWRPLRLWLVPSALKHRRVRARAVMLFRVGAEARTSGGTGILIYLSRAERRAEIVADLGISSKVSPDVWGAAMAAMLGELKAGRAGAGLVAGVRAVGDILAPRVPRAADDVNELPDRLIEV